MTQVVDKVELPELGRETFGSFWEAYKEIFDHINETLAAGKQIFVEITKGRYAGSIMPVTLKTDRARTGTTDHHYEGEFSEVYAKLVAENGIGFNYYANTWYSMVGEVGGRTFEFGNQYDAPRGSKVPAFLFGYEGPAQLVINGKKKTG
jgi:hypothetical protein